MKILKRKAGYHILFFAAAVLCAVTVCSAAAAAASEKAPWRYDALRTDLTEQLVFAYAEENAAEKTAALLKELRSVDPESSRLFEQLFPYWDSVNSGDFVNSAQPSEEQPLPEDLPGDDSLCIVILGYALDADGTMQEELISRLRLGLACARQYPNAYVLVTGGATAKNAPDATEADCMAQWLLENDPAVFKTPRLIIENSSKTHVENAIFSFNILRAEYPQVKEIALVTSDYHVPMVSLLFQARFLLAEYEARTGRTAGSEVSNVTLCVTANAGVCFDDLRSYSLSSQAAALWKLICTY